MEIKSLKCNHCGTNLEIEAHIKYVNCASCGSELIIKKSGNAIFTEVVDEANEQTEPVEEVSELALLEEEIDKLDEEWKAELKKYDLKPGKEKRVGNPRLQKNILIAVITVATLLTAAVILVIGRGHPIAFFLLLVALLVGYSLTEITKMTFEKAEAYEAAIVKYYDRRAELLDKLYDVEDMMEYDEYDEDSIYNQTTTDDYELS